MEGVLQAHSALGETLSSLGVARLNVARGFRERFLGLMFRKSFPEREALLFERCNAVHTCFVRFPIDVAFLDGDGAVLHIERGVRPWKLCIWGGKCAKMTLEMRSAEFPLDRKNKKSCIST